MSTSGLQVEHPGREHVLDQDEERFHLNTDDGKERIRVNEMTWRKNIVDTYGGAVSHGGGHLSTDL
jgi:S-adenosylmethionine synthetase